MGTPIKKEDPPLELESQFVLRLPEHAAEEARKLVIAGTQNLKDKLSIDIRGDGRHAVVRFDQEEFAAKLVDLPCIIESHKTFDKKTLWKTADISQFQLVKVLDSFSVSSVSLKMVLPREAIGNQDRRGHL